MTSTNLRELADKEAIRVLLARYCHLHAAHDFAGVVALFAEDGCFENIAGTAHGRSGILAVYESLNPPAGSHLERKHFTTDVLIDLQGDRAQAESQFLLVRQHAGGLIAAAAGRYQDALTRGADGWQFMKRKVHVDFHGDMGLKQS